MVGEASDEAVRLCRETAERRRCSRAIERAWVESGEGASQAGRCRRCCRCDAARLMCMRSQDDGCGWGSECLQGGQSANQRANRRGDRPAPRPALPGPRCQVRLPKIASLGRVPWWRLSALGRRTRFGASQLHFQFWQEEHASAPTPTSRFHWAASKLLHRDSSNQHLHTIGSSFVSADTSLPSRY